MPLISESYREQNRQLHATNDLYGRSSANWVKYVARMLETEGHTSVLDYGCGKGELKLGLRDAPIAEYDPAIEGKDATPEPADLVVCTDVLEHIEPVHLNAVLRDLRRCTKRKIMFQISTVPSWKTLDDGRNAHLLVKEPTWWREKLKREFRITHWEVGRIGLFCEAFPRAVTRPENIPAPLKRRELTPEWAFTFEQLKETSARYSDPFSCIKTVRMFESVGDEPADCQVICNMLEYIDDVDETLRRAIKLARKLLFVTVQAPPADAGMWKNIFERHVRIAQWQVEEIGLVMQGSPAINVQGIKPIGAVDVEKRFEQVRAASKRITKRIETAEPHRKRAILACYGPSLRGNLKFLRQEAAEINSTIISVSGAHDLLIENGIKPHMHIECDPRPHKTENLTNPQQGVAYYIASACHENMFDKLQGYDTRLWHVYDPDHQQRLIEELSEHPHTSITGGGSVGLRAIPLLYSLGYRDFSIYGMDSSFHMTAETVARLEAIRHLLGSQEWQDQVDKIFEESEIGMWSGKHAGKRMDVVACVCGERIFATSPILLTYATQFIEIAQRSADIQMRLYGDGLLQHMARLHAHMAQQQAA